MTQIPHVPRYTPKGAGLPPPPRESDPRHRWPTAAVLIVVCVCITATLIVADGETKNALLAILGAIGTATAAALPSMLAPRVDQ